MILMVALLFWAGGLWTGGDWQALAVGAAQILPLAVRRRAPGIVLAAVTVATVAHLMLGLTRNIGYVPVLVALYTAPSSPQRTVRWELPGAASLAVALAMIPAKGPVDGALLAVVACGVAWTMGVEHRRHVADRTRLVEHERARAEAQRRERTARHLHDTLAQTTAVMLVQAEALRTANDLSERDRQRVDAILSAGRDAFTEVRRTLRGLADASDAASDTDLPAVLDRLRTAGLRLPADPVAALAGLDGQARELSERVLAEVATNALRHAGPGTLLELDVLVRDDVVHIEAANDLADPAPGAPAGGFGLVSLAGQLRDHGGHLDHGPRGHRWVVTATVSRRG
ncbi:histidine kinase [Prauserella sp. ASG 168]|uniref:histidine kinase n=2 Tax=Prauserella cavernicola TaxID=2800127 RepID=A0A934QYW9_9PSEU|nr:histidine kinase [Prauserella cavernicola]